MLFLFSAALAGTTEVQTAAPIELHFDGLVVTPERHLSAGRLPEVSGQVGAWVPGT